MVVVLRRLGKKDDVTRRKGLEELREGWIAEVLQQGDDENPKEIVLLSAVPVFVSLR